MYGNLHSDCLEQFMNEYSGINVRCTVKIEDGDDLSESITFLRWKSFINDGYMLMVRVHDPNLTQYEQITNEKYLKDARKKPLKISFKIGHMTGGDDAKIETEERIAYMTNLDVVMPEGGQTAGDFVFIAIDPPTWFLNRGDSDGSVWTGKVSTVIKDVISRYAPDIEADVSDTNDSDTNKWWMLRQDPKTFIMTLIDWSSSVTKQKTNWVIASVDEKIIVREQAELPSEDLGHYTVNDNYPVAVNVIKWQREDNNYLSNIQTSVMTAGISAVSGLYCDDKNTKNSTVVNDNNTPDKKNVDLQNDQGFLKPDDLDNGWTFVRSVPEHSAGDVGIKYQDYIDGRARALYLGGLDMLNKIKIVVAGCTKIDNSSLLGASTVYLTWTNSHYEPWTHNGKWMVYGFEHIYTPSKEWYTHLYLNRKDVDANAQKI